MKDDDLMMNDPLQTALGGLRSFQKGPDAGCASIVYDECEAIRRMILTVPMKSSLQRLENDAGIYGLTHDLWFSRACKAVG
jgi:hypothetical protein